jgi:hypothetical protein
VGSSPIVSTRTEAFVPPVPRVSGLSALGDHHS